MLPIYMIFHLDKVSSTYLKRAINEIILANDTRHLWFVLMLFNLFIIFYLIEKYLNKNRITADLSILLIISILSVKLPNIYQISQSLQYLLFFYMGYIFYKHRDKVNALKDKVIWFLIAHLSIFNFDYFIINNFNVSSNNVIYMKLFNLLVDKITAFLGIVFVFAMVQFLFTKRESKLHRLNSNKLFKNICMYNYFIYLVHQPIMLVILKVIRNIPIKPIIVYNILFWSTLFISLNLAKLYYFITSFYKYKLEPNITKKLYNQ